MNRIDQTFENLRQQKRKAFIAFVTAGDPDWETTANVILHLEKAGADLVEIGVPFSDPMADGPTIQASSQRALDRGFRMDDVFRIVARVREQSSIPLLLMQYYNSVFHYGLKRYTSRIQQAGIDGLIIPDLALQEVAPLQNELKTRGLHLVSFVAPTTAKDRMAKIAAQSGGFIYYISVTGVTGARENIPAKFLKPIKSLRKLTRVPVCIGFGLSTPQQIQEASREADGVIVGSAIVRFIAEHHDKEDFYPSLVDFVRTLVSPFLITPHN